MVGVLASSFLLILLAANAVLAVPGGKASQPTGDCVFLRTRRAWHKLDRTEKKAYLDAELCLMSKPSSLRLRGSRTKFDDFQAIHSLKTEIAHFAGQFLPFHRLFVWAHEHALRTECHYSGAQPYWEENLDAGAFSTSIILDPVLGFGGDGAGPGQCIQDGPFANYTNPLGPGYAIQDHCIQRQVNNNASLAAAPDLVAQCLNMTQWLDFWPCIEYGPHSAGHGGIGAQMLNLVSSPGDPIFFLHHTWLDRLWAKWQGQNPATRLKEISGTNKANWTAILEGIPAQPPGSPSLNLERPADVPEPQVVGDPGNVTTLHHLLYLYGLVENRTVGEVMDTRGVLCYEYD